MYVFLFFFFKQKTAYEMRISDWSSDVCSSDLPLADPRKYSGSIADLNLRAVRMGWLPCAPQLDRNPLQVARDAARSGQSAADYVVDGLKSGELDFAYADPDSPIGRASCRERVCQYV